MAAAAATALAALASVAGAAPSGRVPRLVFPVVGPVSYTDDFGDPRGSHRHEGNDLMADKGLVAVAAEAGRVKFWTTSASAGCMLYLYGKSGTTYLYIHLNNDLTDGNDNRGKCVPGVSYADGLSDGDTVAAGEPVGFVGDSGDANGIASHLHFEVHPADGAATDPYPYLQTASRLLFPAGKSVVTVAASGTIAKLASDRVALRVSTLTVFPAGTKFTKLAKPVVFALPSTAQIDLGDGQVVGPDDLAAADATGRAATVLTLPARASVGVAAASPRALVVSRIAVQP